MRNGLDLYRGNRPGIFNAMSDFDELFEKAFSNPWSVMEALRSTPVTDREWFEPQTDIQENDQAYFLSVDLPGLRKEDLKIDVTGRTLSISGERKRETTWKNGGVERVSGKFMRSFTLPEAVDVDRIEANLENGVLQLALPKTEASKPRTIQIGAGKGGFLSKLIGKSESKKVDVNAAEAKSESH